MQKGTLYAAKPLGPRICKETSSNDLVSVYRKTTSRTPAAAAAAAAIAITTMQHASSELSLSISLTHLQCTSACASAGAMLWRSLQYALSHSRPPLHSYSLSGAQAVASHVLALLANVRNKTKCRKTICCCCYL